MMNYLKKILQPLRWVPFPKFGYIVGLLIEGLMFPCMQVFLSLMQKYLVNAVEYQNMHYMTYVYLFAAAIMFMVIILNPFGNFLKNTSMKIFARNLRELSIQKLLSYHYQFYETYQTGDIVSRVRYNLDAIPSIYSDSIFRLLLGLFYGGGSMIIMITFSWQLSLVVIFLGVFESFIMAKISIKITENNEILQKINSRQNQILFDIVKSLSFIKMASISRLMEKRYQMLNEESVEKNIDINNVNVVLNSFNTLFEALNLLLIFSLGIFLYFVGMIDLGSVMSFLILQDGISYMIDNLKGFFSGISSQIVNYNRVAELFNQKVEEDQEKKSCELESNDINISKLSFRYQNAENNALDSIGLVIPKGKMTVIYGGSGGGKSTLIKMLLALYSPSKGNIRIGETYYSQLRNADIRDFYAYVEQSTYLFYDTVEANIRCNNESATFEEVVQAAKLAKAHDLIIKKPNKYQSMVQESGSNFSGGEKQRISIARAILKNAHVIIFDEATNAMDMKNESYIYEHLIEMVNEGKTVLIIAHRDNARQLADHEIRIEQGHVIGG